MKVVLGTPSTEGGNRIPSPRKDVKASATVPIEKSIEDPKPKKESEAISLPKEG